MNLTTLDWTIVFAFFAVSLGIGIWVTKQSGKNTSEFFLSGRNMPWWLLGVSMVATTFSADTPNFVTNVVRQQGISGNWTWWAFLLTGMLTVFVYSRLWRRSGILTDLEFYELRYSGNMASFLRVFRALYLGVFFNIMIMATVSLAAIKIGNVLLGLEGWQTLLITSIITVAYSSMGGLRGVIYTDFVQFFLAMVGAIWAAYVVLNLEEINGLANLLSHPNVSGKLDLFPSPQDSDFYSILIIPIAVQWWSVWYPGAEPGGGGYVVQRMLAAKNEKHAMAATLFFNIAHYALRPWPWIIIALASLVMFPTLDSIQASFPHIPNHIVGDDLAYSAMLTFLPSGLLGLIVASLIAAYMSTISSHLNWGASYIVNDWYKKAYNPSASEQELINVARIATILLMFFSGLIALQLEDALEGFQILLQIGAGTGLIFILRWFWWRINAYSEITAMITSFLLAIYFEFIHTDLLGFEINSNQKLITGVLLTTLAWVIVTLVTRPTDSKTLIKFYQLIQPSPVGWQPIIQEGLKDNSLTPADIGKGQLPLQILMMFLGCMLVYSILFGTGYWLYGNTTYAFSALGISLASGVSLFFLWRKTID